MPTLPANIQRRVQRFAHQRWLLDAIIQMLGIEWDQGRIGYLMAPCGIDAMPDFMGVKQNVKKYDDIAREFRQAAMRREAKAHQFEAEGHIQSARGSYFAAAILYAAAQWSILVNTKENFELEEKKTACYLKYVDYATHPVRRVEIPFGNASLPAYLHLPSASTDNPFPCVLLVPGMDAFKEMMVSLHGDHFLDRGMACLAIDGPGQGECLTHNIHLTATNYQDAGQSALAWLRSQSEIDPDRIAIHGQSFGSLWASQIAAVDHRLKGCAVSYVCHEPMAYTAFEMASPTFKLRYMYMTGYENEADFDRFAQTMTLDGVGSKIQCPYLAVAGEDDTLSQIEYTYELLNSIADPKSLLLYQGEWHGLHSTRSSQLGVNELIYIADWLKDRLDDKPMQSEHIWIDTLGKSHIETWGSDRQYKYGGSV